jgi:hypothetical protein
MSFKKSIDNIYYNVRINGNANGTFAPCNYSEQRTIPLVDNPSEYYFSCTRFSIPTSLIPILIVPAQEFPNTDPSLTVYSVGLSYNGFNSAQTFVRWAPTITASSSTALALPRRQLTSSSRYIDPTDNYYYCNSYTYFMTLVNNAFETAFNDLSGQTALPVGAFAPYYTYNAPTKLFTLVAPEASYDVSTVAQPIKIFLNNQLWNLFGAMSSMIYANPSVSGNDRQVLITGDTSTVDSSGNINFQQEYITVSQWIAMKSVIICTNTIPIVSEGIPSVNGNYTPDNEQNGSSTYLPIISSYDALVSTAGFEDFQSTIQYSPTGPYKLIDMIGTNPLSSFDLQVYWMDVYGTLHTLYLAPYESATMTFLIVRKNSPALKVN